jgi:AcrR family transcriptional regulator
MSAGPSCGCTSNFWRRQAGLSKECTERSVHLASIKCLHWRSVQGNAESEAGSSCVSNRDRILQTVEDLIIDVGVTDTTVALIATRAGVSKGGFFYHFDSKDSLMNGLVERYLQLAEDDLEVGVRSADPVAYFLETSTAKGHLDDPFFRSGHAVLLLANAHYSQAKDALQNVHERWRAILSDHAASEFAVEAILALGDGAYLHSAMGLAESPLRGHAALLADWLRSGPPALAGGSSTAAAADQSSANG